MKRLFIILIIVTTLIWVTNCTGIKGMQTEPDNVRNMLKEITTELGVDKTVVWFARMGYDISDYPPNVQVYHLIFFSLKIRNSLHFYIGFKDDKLRGISIVYREFLNPDFYDHRKLLRRDDVPTKLRKMLMKMHEFHKEKYNELRTRVREGVPKK
jgi:hypothetical protein